MQNLSLNALKIKSKAATIPPASLSSPTNQVGDGGVLAWCLDTYSGGPCPSDGRNTWLTGLALFCNEKGVPETELLSWALGYALLAGHGEKRITAVIRGNYNRKVGDHGSKAFSPAWEQGVGREMRSLTRAAPPGKHPDAETDWLPELLETRKQLQKRSMAPVTFAPPLFNQDEEAVIQLRTINLIQGQTGAHKSRVAELFSTILIADTVPTCDTIGIERNGEPGADYTLCYVDTERSVSEQFPFAIQQMRKRAGYPLDVDPPSFDYISLGLVPRTKRLQALEQYLKYVRLTYHNHLVIVLDVLTDCISSFNDEKESLLLVDLLNRLINTQDVTFLCVIHENPGGMKARGHLGTEAANKASTVLQVGYIKQANGEPSEVVEMRYLKRRSGRPGLVFYMAYDEDSKGLVRADPESVVKAQNSRRTKADAEALAAALFTALAPGPLAAGILEVKLKEHLNASERTIRARLTEMVEGAILVKSTSGREYLLCKVKEGKETHYSLCSPEQLAS